MSGHMNHQRTLLHGLIVLVRRTAYWTGSRVLVIVYLSKSESLSSWSGSILYWTAAIASPVAVFCHIRVPQWEPVRSKTFRCINLSAESRRQSSTVVLVPCRPLPDPPIVPSRFAYSLFRSDSLPDLLLQSFPPTGE